MWRALDEAHAAERSGANGKAAPQAPERGPERLPPAGAPARSNGVSRLAGWTAQLPKPEAEPRRLPPPSEEPAVSVAARALTPRAARAAPAAGREVAVTAAPDRPGAGRGQGGGANGGTSLPAADSQQRQLSELIRVMVQQELQRLAKG